MVDLKTAIDEINTGEIEFTSKSDVCTTEGEVVIYLQRLNELDTPESPYKENDKEHKYPACPYCGNNKHLINAEGNKNKRCGYCGKNLDW